MSVKVPNACGCQSPFLTIWIPDWIADYVETIVAEWNIVVAKLGGALTNSP
jgi:hypothetical protein